MAVLFISHSAKDKAIAGRLASDLMDRGHEVWFDESNIRVGESIPTGIERGIRRADFLLVLLSNHSATSRWVEQEWEAAHWEEIQTGRIAVLPVRLEECPIPLLLQTKKYADMSASYSEGLDELLAAVRYFEVLKKDADFYHAIPTVWAEDRALTDAEKWERSEHWDHFRATVNLLPSDSRLKAQKENTLYYLRKYDITVRQLKEALSRLGVLEGPVDDDLNAHLIRSILRFQVLQNLRHHDGVFGPLTYLKMAEVAQHVHEGA